jgi:hypothetical protein
VSRNFAPHSESGCALWSISLSSQNSPPQLKLPHLRSIVTRGDGSNLLDKLLVPELQKVSFGRPGPWIASQRLALLFSRRSIRVVSKTATISSNMIQILPASADLVELDLRGCIDQIMTKSFLTIRAPSRFDIKCAASSSHATHHQGRLHIIAL